MLGMQSHKVHSFLTGASSFGALGSLAVFRIMSRSPTFPALGSCGVSVNCWAGTSRTCATGGTDTNGTNRPVSNTPPRIQSWMRKVFAMRIVTRKVDNAHPHNTKTTHIVAHTNDSGASVWSPLIRTSRIYTRASDSSHTRSPADSNDSSRSTGLISLTIDSSMLKTITENANREAAAADSSVNNGLAVCVCGGRWSSPSINTSANPAFTIDSAFRTLNIHSIGRIRTFSARRKRPLEILPLQKLGPLP